MNTRIFTDGASRGNPGPGGWGAIIASEEHVVELGGREEKTTNNRMELQAVVSALQYCTNNHIPCAHIYTDSRYVVKGATHWISDWKKRDWKTAGKQDVLHQDLWQKLADLSSAIEVVWHMLPGHAGIAGNERADAIATAYADAKETNLYEGPRNAYTIDINTMSTSKEARMKKKNRSERAGKKAYSYVSAINGDVKTHASWTECEARVKGVSGARYKKALSEEDERNIKREFKK